MLFTTSHFAFLFLPIVAIGFFLLGRAQRVAAAWLGLASIFFYGYWMPAYVVLLLVSIATNYGIGVAIGRLRDRSRDSATDNSRLVLLAGLVFNLGLLSYFKYAHFFLDTLHALSSLNLPTAHVALPIGISFFTFTQIAFLVDTYQKGTREYRCIHYLLFVTYFPHLVAGPVLHHAQMMPQFSDPAIYRASPVNIAAGLTLFALGLVKKIVVADCIAPYADAVFDAAAAGQSVTPHEAWIGALAYSFQLYFDFSGYSDMAVGLSMIFGVRLPYNFASPYRATNIADFWRRWHMTLSAFLRDYLYIALGGNRRGRLRRQVNLMVTMLLGGLWHGANWTFVVWGGLHGLYLVVQHAFGSGVTRALTRFVPSQIVSLLGWFITMLVVVVAWVFFRATDFSAAGSILNAMRSIDFTAGLNLALMNSGLSASRGVCLIAICLLLATWPANSNRIFERHLEACCRSASLTWISIGGGVTAIAALVFVNELRASTSPFIYFNF